MDLCCATADPRKIQKDDKLVFNKLPNEPKNGMPPDRNPHLHSTYHVLTSLVPEACALSPFSLRELNLREPTKLGTWISLKKLAIKPMLQITDLSGEGCSIPIIIFFPDVNYLGYPWMLPSSSFLQLPSLVHFLRSFDVCWNRVAANWGPRSQGHHTRKQ